MERPMNTAGRDRAVQAIIEKSIKRTEKKHTPVSRIKVAKGDGGAVNVAIHTSRPTILRLEADEIKSAITEQVGDKKVNVTVVPEARAVAKFVRMSPRKARLVAEAVKGKRVSEALAILNFIPNHASEPILKVVKSAAANAQDGWGAIPEELRVHNIIADGGPILKRIRARAQGRAYRILKRTTHLTVVLVEAPAPAPRRRAAQPAGRGAAATAPAPATTGRKARAPKPVEKQEETKARLAERTPESGTHTTTTIDSQNAPASSVLGVGSGEAEAAALGAPVAPVNEEPVAETAPAIEATAEETPVAETPATDEAASSDEPASEG